MSAAGVYIVLGDLLVSGFLVGLAAYLYVRGGKEVEDAARIPLEEDDE